MKIPSLALLSSSALLIVLTLPSPSIAASKLSEQAGSSLFVDKGCTHCHGQGLQGTQKGPALTNVRKTMKAPAIANQIENGGQNMPPFGDSLSHGEIMQLVDFLRAKHRPILTAPPSPAPGQKPSVNP